MQDPFLGEQWLEGIQGKAPVLLSKQLWGWQTLQAEKGLAWAMMIHIQQQEDLILHLAGYSCQIMSDR